MNITPYITLHYWTVVGGYILESQIRSVGGYKSGKTGAWCMLLRVEPPAFGVILTDLLHYFVVRKACSWQISEVDLEGNYIIIRGNMS